MSEKKPLRTKAQPTLKDLLEKPKLTGRESTDALRLLASEFRGLVANQTTLNGNQESLQKTLVDVAKRVERLYREIFDHRSTDGGIIPGLSSSFKRVAEIQQTHEGKLADVFKSNQALRRVLAWEIGFFVEKNRLPTVDEMNAEYAEIMDELEVQGEYAAAAQRIFKDTAQKMFRCSGCVHWKKKGLIEVVGGDSDAVEARCTRGAVQLRCPACTTLYPLPIDPMNVTEKCGKTGCGTALVREVEDKETERVATLCANYECDIEQLRQRLLDEEIAPAIVEALLPTE